jgi:hypothetical protein
LTTTKKQDHTYRCKQIEITYSFKAFAWPLYSGRAPIAELNYIFSCLNHIREATKDFQVNRLHNRDGFGITT